MVFIMNFNNSRDLSDIEESFDKYHGTNINFLLDDFSLGSTRWSVPEKAIPGDIAIFMCAKEARHNLGMATSHIPADYSAEFHTFVNNQKALYKRYSGQLLGYGIVSSIPKMDDGWWMADIGLLIPFNNTIYIDEFKSFISISKTNSITYISDDQWERLKWVINRKNQGLFPNAIPPDKDTLEKEFNNAVQRASGKPVDSLKKSALKKSSQSTVSTVQTKVYYRDPVLAAYVKKRADGYCQLCGKSAPFKDQNGEPYLECHHIEWLSKGGMDSIDNCVALCPNCHRKMHIINNDEDVKTLKSRAKKLSI